jgi:acyl-CoA synthetase (NDP forming)
VCAGAPIVRAARGAKPLAAFLTPHAERSLALLAAQGIPAFRTPEACADALGAYFAWRAPKELSKEKSFFLKEKQDPLELLAALGIPVVEQAVARAPDFRHSISYPVALKKIAVAHKTEVGGVLLGIASDSELKDKTKSWKDQTILVQKMESGLAEAIVGYRDDPVVGPIVLVGAGGVLAELYRDFAIRTAPVGEEEARAMVEEVKGLAPIRGYRNLPRGDLDALSKAIMQISRLALVDGIAEAEINPLIVKAAGVVAVDGLVVPKE